MKRPPSPLAKISAASRALAEATSIPDVQDVRDKAAAIAYYMKQQNASLEALNAAAELKLRAERRIGELLAETVKPGNPQLSKASTIDEPPTLDELWLSRDQSSCWQRIARIPDQDFEKFLTATKAEGIELTTAAAVRLAKSLTPTEPKEKAFSFDKRWDAIHQWIEDERASWPEEFRIGFIATVRRILDAIERDDANTEPTAPPARAKGKRK